MRDENMEPWQKVIYLVRSGSHAYGTNTPESDLDTRGICIPPAQYITGLSTFEQRVEENPDRVIFAIHKFFKLALDCNPNIIELLFVRDEDWLQMAPEGVALHNNRNLFLSRHAFNTFGGYAHAQLKKLQNRSTKTARHGTHAVFVEKYSYDTKAAAHLVRLYRSGVELLRDGKLQVYRPDREELLDIRNGKWTLAQVEAEAERLNHELQAARDVSPLPKKPDYAKAEKLLLELVRPTLEDYYAHPQNRR